VWRVGGQGSGGRRCCLGWWRGGDTEPGLDVDPDPDPDREPDLDPDRDSDDLDLHDPAA